jgi:hypothetical protein
MRRFAFIIALLAALTVAGAASAEMPSGAVTACQAEYAKLGADAFLAKYGPTEPWGHCYAQHTPTPPPTTTTTTTTDSPVVAACKAEYAQLGADAFVAKYGPTEPWGHCYTQHAPAPAPTTDNPAVAACKAEYLKLGAVAFAAKYGGNEALGQCVKLHTTPKPTAGDAALSVATAFCQALAKTLGKSVFLTKYGPQEAMGNCVRMSLANAKSLVAACKTSSGASKDAFRACLAAGLQPRRSY